MIEQLAAPARAVGGFVEMTLDTFVKIFRHPFQFREFLDQTWMIARVVGVGVLTAQRDSASVMVYMNRTVTDKSKTPIYDGSRLRVDYQKIDGKWLIKYITPI